MSAIELFQNGEFSLDVELHEVDGFRVHAPAVARQLGFRDAYRLLESIPDSEKGYTTACTPGGEQRTTYLTEAGFYRALGQRQTSRISDDKVRAVVERFQAWVYREVLPAIRRGELVAAKPAPPQTYAEALRELAASVEEREQLATKVAELTPAAESWQHLVNAEGDHDLRDAAHMLSRIPGVVIGQNQLADLLRDLEWVDVKTLRPFQTQIKTGRLVSRLKDWTHPDTGVTYTRAQPRITPKGMGWLHDHLLAAARKNASGQESLL